MFFVAAPPFGQVYVLDEQTDHSLVVTDTIYLGSCLACSYLSTTMIYRCIYSDRPIDNLAVDHNGNVWGAGEPSERSTVFFGLTNKFLTGLVNALHLTGVHFENPSIASPSSAIRFSLNDGQSKFFGEKYKVETVRWLTMFNFKNI